MRILSVEIHNLASLEGTHHIDFTEYPLKNAGIFAITGPTGAGKSTIFDAMCLALFDTTPRLEQTNNKGAKIRDGSTGAISVSDPGNILRRGKAEAWAEVVFSGVDGGLYQARWSIHRAAKKATGALQSQAMKLTNLQTGNFESRKTEVLARIKEVLGLTYEQFVRSVLLAQGGFTAFLNAKQNDRADILEKLTGTEIYSVMSRKVRERNNEVKEEFRRVEQRIADVGLLPLEEVAQLQMQLAALDSEIQQLTANRNTAEADMRWHDELQTRDMALASARAALDEAKGALASAEPQVGELGRVRRVRPILPKALEKAAAQRKKMEKVGDLTTLNTEMLDLESKAVEMVAQVHQAAEDHARLEEAHRALAPQLLMARELDVRIKEGQGRLTDAEAELANAAHALDALRKGCDAKISVKDRLTHQLREAEEWLAKHRDKQQAAEQFPLIADRLKRLGEVEFQMRDLQKRLADNDLSRRDIEKKQLESAHNQVPLHDKFEKASAAFKMAEIEYEAISASDVAGRTKLANDKRQYYTNARATWKEWYNAHQALAEKKAKEIEAAAQAVQAESQVKANADALTKATAAKDAVEKLLTTARLQAAENVDHLRSSLEDGVPCPVCGSKEHPFTATSQDFNRLLQAVEAEYAEHDRACNALRMDIAALEEAAKGFGRTQSDLQAEIATLGQNVSNLQANWEALNPPAELMEVAENEREEWMNVAIADIQKEICALVVENQKLDKSQKAYEAMRSEREALQKALQSANDRLAELAAGAGRLETERSMLEPQLESHRRAAGDAMPELNAIFGSDEWYANWQGNQAGFLNRLDKFAKDWANNTAQVQKTGADIQTATAELELMQLQLQQLGANVTEKQVARNALGETVSTLKAERVAIFGGNAADGVEKDSLEAVQRAGNQLQSTRALQDDINQKTNHLRGRLDGLKNEIAELDADALSLEGEIGAFLDAADAELEMPMGRERWLELLVKPDKWIADRERMLDELKSALERATTIFIERQDHLKQHSSLQPQPREREEVEKALGALKEDIAEKTKTRTEVDFKLKSNELKVKDVEALTAELEYKRPGYDLIKSLDTVIGSGDGSKFSRIAQEYTLDVLLSYANVHLNALEPRYRFERIPDSSGLDMQIVDSDMGNEIRPINSLSGGESFLASLSLALGLASITSGKMKVESLFIDEGFGSLDPDTLNVAMDALEKLHQQGRKVGVITHVREMTERIPTQIKVVKMNGGRSRIEICG